MYKKTNKNLSSEEQYEKFLKKSFNILSRKDYSVIKFKEKLKDHGCEDEKVSNQIIDRLSELNLLNDEKFARNFIENQIEYRPSSLFPISIKLSQKGIDRDLCQKIWDDINPNLEEISMRLAKTKSKNMDLNNQKDMDRLTRFLASRGFSWDEIKSTIDEIKSK